jgi:hypothetical protein
MTDQQRVLVGKWLAKGMSHKQIAGLLEMKIAEVRRIAKSLATIEPSVETRD